jgi:multicomponent Na+:H+ antiporter subunit G
MTPDMLHPDTLHIVLHLISWALILIGSVFALIGALGIIRFPDVFARMHAAGIIDTMGIGPILIGLMFQAHEWIVVVKLGLVLVFVFFTSPTTTFALARAALDDGMIADPLPELNEIDQPSQHQEAK